MTAPDVPFEAPFDGGAPMEPERPAVQQGLGIAAGTFAFSVLVGLGSSVATSRLYGIRIIGEYAFVSVPYLIVSQLSSVNEQTAFVREAATMRRREPRLNALFRAVLGFSTLLTAGVGMLGMLLGTLLLRGPLDRPELVLPAAVVLAGYVLLDNIGWNMDSVLSAFRAADVLFVVRGTQVVTFLVAGVGLEPVLHSVWGLVWATVLSFAVPLAVRIAVLPRYVGLSVAHEDRRAARRKLPELIRFGAVLLPSQILFGVKQQSGTWVVGSMAGAAVTGAYSRALGLASKLSDAAYRISEILLPGLVERGAADRDAAGVLLARTVRLAAIPLAVLVAAVGGAATGVLQVFGQGFDRASAALALLFGSYALTVVCSVQAQGFLADGRPWLLTRLSLVSSAISLALVLPLGLSHGAGGVALALLLGPAVEFVLLDRALGRHFGIGASLLGGRTILGLALVVSGGFAASWGVQRVDTSLVWTAVSLAAGAGAAAALALGLGLVRAEDRALALARIRSRRA